MQQLCVLNLDSEMTKVTALFLSFSKMLTLLGLVHHGCGSPGNHGTKGVCLGDDSTENGTARVVQEAVNHNDDSHFLAMTNWNIREHLEEKAK